MSVLPFCKRVSQKSEGVEEVRSSLQRFVRPRPSLLLSNMIATPIENIDLGVVSIALGSSRVLSNGNYEWQAGFVNNGKPAITFEYTPSGTLVYKQQTDSASYRSFRWQNLYSP